MSQGNLFRPDAYGNALPKLNRNRDASRGREVPTSREAFQRQGDSVRELWRRRVLRYIREQRSRGATAQETADALGVDVNRISGRFTELRDDAFIRRTGERRKTKHSGNGFVHVAAYPAPGSEN